jgi:glyoxylase-like metal-dependent hydrolase (beta-lactamase superfamily II)
MNSLTGGATSGTEALIPDLALTDGQEIVSGGMTVRVHIVPEAHSNTDAMFEVVEDSLLYTGDNVTYHRMPRFDDGTFRGTLAACDHALSLNLEHYVPGHGPSGGAEVVESFRRYTSTLYQKVGELYGEGLSDFEMKPQIVAALEEYQEWASFDEFIGRTVSLAVLEAEAAAFE